MSKTNTSISRRLALLSNKLNEHGFCVICSKEGKLTKDHVPPTSARLTAVDSQKTALEFFIKEGVIKPQKITTGNYSRTICSNCNNKILGSLDVEIGNVHKQLVSLIKMEIDRGYDGSDKVIEVTVNALDYLRAMVGHLISALPPYYCKAPFESPYYTPLKKFVMGDSSEINNFDFYYWFFPMKYQMVTNNFAYQDLEKMQFSSGSIISFFPISFMIIDKTSKQYNEGYGVALPKGSSRINISDKRIKINLASWNDLKNGFPYLGLGSQAFYIFDEDLSFISYKK